MRTSIALHFEPLATARMVLPEFSMRATRIVPQVYVFNPLLQRRLV